MDRQKHAAHADAGPTNMKPTATGLGLLAAAIASLAPAAALAQEALPPDNSAVNQYTESFPTSDGGKDVHGDDKGRERSPREVLGRRNTQRLEQRGETGRAVAELAAETAPPSASADPDDSSSVGASGGNDDKLGRGGAGGGGVGPAASAIGGSSPVGEVLQRATGLSGTSGVGLWLPWAILAILAWATAYRWRQARRNRV